MKCRKQILVLITLAVAFISQAVFAQMHVDPDTGKEIKDGFDISIFANVSPTTNGQMAFSRGGAWGTDLYVSGANHDTIYRVDSAGSVSTFADAPVHFNGLAFPNPGSAFGDYMYLGSGDGYWFGDKSIYRVDR